MTFNPTDLGGFGGDFAGNVAANFLNFTLKSLARVGGGDPEAKAVLAAQQRAVQAAADRVLPHDDDANPALRAAAIEALQSILATPAVSEALVEACTLGRGDVDELTHLAERAGLDPTTLPFAWCDFLLAFLGAFQREIWREASRGGSPLLGRVALGELFRLRTALTRRVEPADDRVDYLVQSLLEVGRGLPFKDYLLEYKQFLAEYLGRAGRPKPFGGRAFELQALDDWLADPNAAGRLLLAAPAGRGKSALIAHWVRQLPRDIALIFVPVSLRFQTADPTSFLPAMALKLAQLHGIALDDATVWNPTACRNAISALLQRSLPDGRLLLLVVDGLDEASGGFHWGGLIPTETPSNVRIVVSARQLALDDRSGGWLTRLAWDGFAEAVRPLELPGLDPHEVAEVLDGMGLTPLDPATRAERAQEVWRLTAGDPLLVGLYAEQLWRQEQDVRAPPWRIEDLRRIDPGLKAFFERWAQDQEALWGGAEPWSDATVRAVLAVLAQALGPMMLDDLREVCRRAFNLRLGAARAFLAPLTRFVVGDGTQHGLVLAHPRLNEFFASAEFIGADERDTVEAAFLAWGEAVVAALNAGLQEPERTPAYLLRHHSSHLIQSCAPRGAFHALLGGGWAIACERADPTFRGLLNDVQRAWDNLAADPQDLAAQARCLLFFGSLQSPYQLPPSPIFAAAIKLGELTARQVLNILAFGVDRSDFDERAEQLAPVLASTLGPELADLIDLRPPMIGKVRALAALATACSGPERIRIGDRAVRAARTCSDDFERLCAGALVLPFRGGDAARDAAEIAADLAEADSRRVSPDVVAALAPYAPETAADLAAAGVWRYFVLAGFAPDPAGRRMMALVSEAKRHALIADALARSLEDDLKDHGAVLAIVSPALDADQRQAAWAKVRAAPLEKRLVLLSQLIDQTLAAAIPDLAITILEALRNSGGAWGSLAFVDWAPLLAVLPESERATVVSRILETFGHHSGSSNWLDLTAQLLPHLSAEQSAQTVVIAVRKGRLHHDQSALLQSLGGLLPLITGPARDAAERRLTDRVDLYLAERPLSEDSRRTVLALPLLSLASPTLASVIAEELYATHLAAPPGHIAQLCQIMAYLGPATRPSALRIMQDWIAALDWAPSEPSLMEAAEPWIGRAAIETAAQRMVRQAAAEPEPQLAAFSLAHLLRFLDPASAQSLSSNVFSRALAEADWDDQWCFVVRSCLPHLDEETVATTVFPAAMQRPYTQDNRLSLVLDTADRSHGETRLAILRRALDMVAPHEWPIERLPLVLQALAPEHQSDLISDVLRTHVADRRVRQLRVLDALAPWIVASGDRAGEDLFAALWDVSAWWP